MRSRGNSKDAAFLEAATGMAGLVLFLWFFSPEFRHWAIIILVIFAILLVAATVTWLVLKEQRGRQSVSEFEPVNSGAAAGQTVLHCHFHLIPRRNGDTQNPTGGVRGVIPGKMNYR